MKISISVWRFFSVSFCYLKNSIWQWKKKSLKKFWLAEIILNIIKIFEDLPQIQTAFHFYKSVWLMICRYFQLHSDQGYWLILMEPGNILLKHILTSWVECFVNGFCWKIQSSSINSDFQGRRYASRN